MSCEEKIFRQLRERGLRLTPQREMVLSIMHKMDGFATADEIYEQVHVLSSSVDISTVYRTLDLLQEFHVVAVVDRGGGQRRYRLSEMNGPRLHLVCRSCGEIIGLSLEQLQPLAAHLNKLNGFEVDLDGVSIAGLCQVCSLPPSEARRI